MCNNSQTKKYEKYILKRVTIMYITLGVVFVVDLPTEKIGNAGILSSRSKVEDGESFYLRGQRAENEESLYI